MLKILLFSASRRQDSYNTRLAEICREALENLDVQVDWARVQDFDCPSYDADDERDIGIPDGAAALRDRLIHADGFMIVSPEYNASVPGNLKNIIDWTSRFKPQPFQEKHALLMSASPSMTGGNRGLWALRIPLEHLSTRVYPDMFSLAQAHQAFKDDGKLKNDELQNRLESTIKSWVELVEASKHYPCAKAKWVEFLGEMPDLAFDRVQG